MQWFDRMRKRIGMSLLGGTPFYDGIGGGRRALAWQVGNPGAVAALAFTQNELRAKSRDLVRRNAWAAAGVEAFVSNAIGTTIYQNPNPYRLGFFLPKTPALARFRALAS